LVGISDQVVSSAGNFALFVLVARAVKPSDFGAFTVAYLIYVLLQGAGQAVLGEPLLITESDSGDTAGDAHGAARTGALLLGLAASALIIAGAWVLPAPLRDVALTLSLVLPGLLVQDLLRLMALAIGRPGKALVLDCIWTFGWILLVWISPFGQMTAARAVLSWGLVGSASAIVGLALLPAKWASPAMALGFLKSRKSLVAPSFAEFATVNASVQLAALAATGFVGLAPAGGFRAAQSLFGPANTLANAVRLVAVPEFVRIGATSARANVWARRLSFAGTLSMTGAVALVLALPTSFGDALFGASWSFAQPTLLAVGLQRVVGLIALGETSALKARGQVAAGARPRMAGAIATAFGTLVVAAGTRSIWAVAWVGVVTGLLMNLGILRAFRRTSIYAEPTVCNST
jgi:O-antigen/teichoic acid export membrane protein